MAEAKFSDHQKATMARRLLELVCQSNETLVKKKEITKAEAQRRVDTVKEIAEDYEAKTQNRLF